MHVNQMLRELPTNVIHHLTKLVVDNDLTSSQADILIRHEWLHEQYRQLSECLRRTYEPLWFWEDDYMPTKSDISRWWAKERGVPIIEIGLSKDDPAHFRGFVIV